MYAWSDRLLIRTETSIAPPLHNILNEGRVLRVYDH
jgi:hypothetical protein